MEPSCAISSPRTGRSAVGRINEHGPTGNVPGLNIQESQSWGMICAALVNRDAGEVDWLSDHHRMHCALTDMSGTVRTDDGPLRKLSWLRNMISFTPSGARTRCNLPAGRSIQILQNRDTYNNIISDIVRGGTLHIEPLASVNDPLVSQIVATLANEMKGGYLDRSLADALNSALAVRCRRDLCWNLIGAVSGWMRIGGQAARSIGLSASFWVRLCHPSTLRMVI